MSDLIVERRGPALWLTLNRPEVFNCMSPEACCKLQDAWQMLETDDELRVAVVTGTGDRAFCSGADLKRLIPLYTGAREPEDEWDRRVVEMRKAGRGGFMKDRIVAKPIIAAVNGVAMGGGFEIALACDLIIASENATFALPEPRVGLAALAGGVHRLPRQIGLKRAMGMILTARHVSAKEGLELGFVNEVVPQGEALAAAERWAETITKNSPMSIRASKQAIQKGLEVSLEQALAEQREYPAVKAMAASQDYIEGPKAFSEKRPPKWLGR